MKKYRYVTITTSAKNNKIIVEKENNKIDNAITIRLYKNTFIQIKNYLVNKGFNFFIYSQFWKVCTINC